ncbi:MAG: VTC domain-containing protein, partial [Bacillota bacterium]
ELQTMIRGEGRCIVSYIREAWVTPSDNSVRMTFDRALTSTPWNGTLVVADFLCGVHPPIAGAVLELKFTNRFPLWMRDMVRIFNLPRMSMAKYVNCIQAMHPHEAQLTELSRIGAVI